MLDVVDYKLPFRFLGQLMHPIVVKKQLHKIFTYREQKLAEIFGTVEGETPSLELKSI